MTGLVRRQISALVAAVFLFAAFVYPEQVWSMAETPLITDPDDPRFDPKHFRFENYSETNDHFKRSITKMFPPGTDRACVEKILIEQGGATGGKNEANPRIPPELTSYTYRWPPGGMGTWLVRFHFDANDKSTMMTMGAGPIYGADPLYEWVQERKRKRRERYGK
jgi:hypothetical protein